MSTVPGTPSSLAAIGATAARRVVFEARLRRDSVRPSVFEQLSTAIKVVDNMMTSIKTAIFMKVNESATSGQSIRMSKQTPMTQSVIYGTENAALGSEDEQGLVWTELFYNEIKKPVKYFKYGYNYNDTAYLNLLESNVEGLTVHMAENRDVRIHQALTVTCDEGLTYAPISKTPMFNKNWIIPNLADASFPAWESTATTTTDGVKDSDNYYSNRTYTGASSFVNNLAPALMAASGTASVSLATFSVGFLTNLQYLMPNKFILEPIELDGMATYIILVASRVAAWMRNPNNTGSWGEYNKNVAAYALNGRMPLIGEMGRAGNCVFVENLRAPTLTVSGSVNNYTIKVGYLQPGNNDDRNNDAWSNTSGSTNYVFDLCYVLGKESLAEFTQDKLNTNLFENTEYGKIEGRLAYTGTGIQIPVWDKDTPTDSTQIQRGCAVIPVSRRAVETIV